MEELKKNGPLVMSFRVEYEFSLYEKGIFHQVDSTKWIKNGEIRPEWRPIDHSGKIFLIDFKLILKCF